MNLAGEDLFFDNQIGMAKQVVTTASMYMSRGGFNEKIAEQTPLKKP